MTASNFNSLHFDINYLVEMQCLYETITTLPKFHRFHCISLLGLHGISRWMC